MVQSSNPPCTARVSATAAELRRSKVFVAAYFGRTVSSYEFNGACSGNTIPAAAIPSLASANLTDALQGHWNVQSTAPLALQAGLDTGKVIAFQDVESRLFAGPPGGNLSDAWSDNRQASLSPDGQQTQSDNSNKPGTIKDNEAPSKENAAERARKRILGIIPNYRTSPSLKDFKPLAPKEKCHISVVRPSRWHQPS